MDDCNNFLGGYFLLHGQQLFSQIFFNHAPFMAPLSEFVQFVTRPQNLHEIILRHRQFGLLFDFLSEVGLLLRFGIVGIPFALVFELSKFYLGGDRFLAEGYIVYPLTYVLGLVLNKFFKKKVYSFDYIVSATCTWFVIFMREPYSLAAIILLSLLLWGKEERKIKIISGAFFLVLSGVTLLSYNIYEFFYNVVYVNQTTLKAENTETHFLSIQLYKSFLYPFIIFFQGEWQFVRYIEITISSLFLFVSGFFFWKRKWMVILFLWITLGIANIRFVSPGHEYYGAFHLLPWFALTIFVTSYLLWEIKKWSKWVTVLGLGILAALVVCIIFSKGSYIHDTIDQQTEFITNYGQVLQVGNVVHALSTPKNTLFVDGFDDMVYMVAQRYSDYSYSWYTSLMPEYTRYTDARLSMFANNPPDFYYGNCPKEKQPHYLLPAAVKNEYINIFNEDKASCLWVRKSKLSQISDMQWQKAGESLYYLQPTNH